MFQTKAVEKIKTHILRSITFFSSESRAVYEIIWENVVELGRPQMKIRRMCIAFWMTRATDTHSEYSVSPWSRVLLKKLNVSHPVKKFRAFYRTRRFITAFTSVRHLSQS
jgi:hypothetical protein